MLGHRRQCHSLAQKLKGNFISRLPTFLLNTATGEKKKARRYTGSWRQLNVIQKNSTIKIYGNYITDPVFSAWIFYKNLTSWWTWRRNEGFDRRGEEIPLFSASRDSVMFVLAKEKTLYQQDRNVLSRESQRLLGNSDTLQRTFLAKFPRQVSCGGHTVDLKKGSHPVRILNLDHKPKTIDKGVVIATCEPVVDTVARPSRTFPESRLPSIFGES
ncbi:hypothetical protein AVEN_129062-1 [Araneus ventricosus]|uniref:Uncharacterized protein n=1 Tax=Araneus ventricosus TaxID=182803 RepID=A0A4Y2TUH2_ARAVE|nr:hypothetical protein AVEN_129062-1 [Araneus ventricosus]